MNASWNKSMFVYNTFNEMSSSYHKYLIYFKCFNRFTSSALINSRWLHSLVNLHVFVCEIYRLALRNHHCCLQNRLPKHHS